jgi:superfamily II DNA or RNA helicase
MKQQVARIRILDEVYVNISGIHPSDHRYYYDKYAPFAPNYFFNPKFKLGSWDGKIRFYKDNGTTYLYLIEEIVASLISQGYAIDVEDLREISIPNVDYINADIFSDYIHPNTGEPITLRKYQIDASNKLIEHGNGIIRAGTGAGKTLITAALTKTYGDAGVRVITIVPDSGLVTQTRATYELCGLDVGEYSGTEKTLDHQHIVSTWQALQNNPSILLMFGALIIDECHGVKGPVLRDLVIEYAGTIPFRFGVTGTLPPEESDALMVLCALGPIRASISAAELIAAGVLSEVHIDVIQLEEDFQADYQEFLKDWNLPGKPPTYAQFKDGYFGDYAAEKSYLHRNEDRIDTIAQIIMSNQDKRQGNVLCLVDSIPFGRTLADRIPGSIFVNGQDIKKASDRKKVYDMFSTHDDLVVIATVHIASTGLDIPRIFSLMLVDAGKSFIRIIQSIGRGLRKAKDKDKVNVIDIASDLKYGKKHLATRLKYYNEAEYPYKKHKVRYK